MASTLRRWAAASVTAASLGGCVGYVTGMAPPSFRIWTAANNAEANADTIGSAAAPCNPGRVDGSSRPARRERGPSSADFEGVAQKVGQDLVISVFRDEETLGDLTKLLVRTFTDARVKQDLSVFFKEQFTEDERTVAALKKFLVTDVLGDAWVRDELLAFTAELGSGIAADEAVWPNQTLATLGDAGLEALQTDEFREHATAAAISALKQWRS